MPILVRGNGGAKEFATITVKDTGEINATTKKGTAHHWLSNRDDADFVAENIKSGVNIFGKLGTYKGHEWVSDIDAKGKQTVTVSCSFKPKGILLLPTDTDKSLLSGDRDNGIALFGHFPEHESYVVQRYALLNDNYYAANAGAVTESAFTSRYNVAYSEKSVTVNLIKEDYYFIAMFDAIVFG